MFKLAFNKFNSILKYILISVEVALKYIKDYCVGHYRGAIINGRDFDGTPMMPVSEFMRKFVATPAYCFLIIFLICNWEFYLIFFYMFILTELILLFVRLFVSSNVVFAARSSVFCFILYYVIKHGGFGYSNPAAGGLYASIDFISNLAGLTPTDQMYWLNSANQLVEFHNAIIFLKNYFLVVVLPYLCAGAIIVLPAASCLILFSFGSLLGYELAGLLSSFMIFFSCLSSSYLFFVYPNRLSIFVELLTGQNSFSWNCFFNPANSAWTYVSKRSWSSIEQEIIGFNSPFENVNVVQALSADAFNLSLDFGDFINIPFFWASIDFVIDSVSIIVVFVVTFISTIVHFYSIVYMQNDPHKIRFFALLSMFTFFMIVLVLSANVIMLYIGWEGVGLSSFLLISFWFTRVSAVKAALKAILINKIGDLLIIFSASLLVFYAKGSTLISNFGFTVAEKAGAAEITSNFYVLDLIACTLVVSAFVKSAQIFFHTWLADAMEGPTPVSALLHAATMVTAGVYLVIRFSYIIEFSAYAKAFLFFGGFFTIIFSSLVACAQYDIKKIVAYSTCSQLGLMFFACGLSAYDLALFHFFNHAFFKCLLFLLSGIIIHELGNEQDIRKMGGLAIKMPFVFLGFTVATLSLVGFPGFSGAISKDLILHLVNFSAASFVSVDLKSAILLFSSNVMIYLTMAYSFRLLYFVFLSPANYRKTSFGKNYVDIGLRNFIYSWIIIILIFMSLFSGSLFKNLFVLSDSGHRVLNIHKEILILNEKNKSFLFDADYKFIAFFLTIHALLAAIYCIYYVVANRKKVVWYLPHNYNLFLIFKFFNRKCYFDEIYNIYVARTFIKLSYVYNRGIEDGFFKSFLFFLYWFIKLPIKTRILSKNYYILDHLYLITFSLIFIVIWIL